MALSSRMPELSALEVFLAVARTASLGAAGRELGLTQQAVSARLASIEAQTGVRLAVRTVTVPGGHRCAGGRCSGAGAGPAMPPHSRRGSSGEWFTRRAVGDLGP